MTDTTPLAAGIHGIDHIDIAVEDVEAAAQFYLAVGFAEVRRTPHSGGAIELRFPGEGDQPVLELVPCTKPDGSRLCEPGVRHIALRVTNIQKIYQDLSAKGVPFKKEPGFYDVTERWLLNAIPGAAPMLQFTTPESSS